MNYDESKSMDYNPDLINKVDKDGVRRGFFGYDYRQLQKDPDWAPDEANAVSQVMRQGQFIIFWSTLMHASHPHLGLTDNMRLGFAGRYLPTSVHVYPTLTHWRSSAAAPAWTSSATCWYPARTPTGTTALPSPP